MWAMLSWRVPSRALTWWLSQQVGEDRSHAYFSSKDVFFTAMCIACTPTPGGLLGC
jgi:hypothetical protein